MANTASLKKAMRSTWNSDRTSVSLSSTALLPFR
jgi:hypothetical protein